MANNDDLLSVLTSKEDILAGKSVSNDPYASCSLTQYLTVVKSTCDSIELLASAELNIEDFGIEEIVNETQTKYNENSNSSGVDVTTKIKLGPTLTKGGVIAKLKVKCPGCGTELDELPKAGFCSTKCALKYLSNKIIALVSKSGNKKSSVDKYLQTILDYINVTINLAQILPGITVHTQVLSSTYRKLTTLLINQAMLQLKQVINKILIWKNDLVERILKWVCSGVVPDWLETLFTWLKMFQATLTKMKKMCNEMFGVVQGLIQATANVYGLEGEYMGFLSGFYPRSMKNHPGKMFVDLPVKTLNLKQSAIQIVNFDLIESLILAAFPPITAAEYFIDPDAFKKRVLWSDQNIAVVKPIIMNIEKYAKMGAEFLPTYENLNFKNVWFLVAMVFGWGPVTKEIYGSLF